MFGLILGLSSPMVITHTQITRNEDKTTEQTKARFVLFVFLYLDFFDLADDNDDRTTTI